MRGQPVDHPHWTQEQVYNPLLATYIDTTGVVYSSWLGRQDVEHKVEDAQE
ncbi:hypothetical protein L195_g034594 [Trifolium pratense]|uniref:Uncharacterized protein n=1 Tax=Trifolium pratense TaxID=57577 RepID=A0A2K3LJB4_TRIPR|nr:hypothetical protein L195_g034594 [Trifolium pratense]